MFTNIDIVLLLVVAHKRDEFRRDAIEPNGPILDTYSWNKLIFAVDAHLILIHHIVIAVTTIRIIEFIASIIVSEIISTSLATILTRRSVTMITF